MRLISARVTGLGRLVDVEVDLDQKVVAIVGPNEAGKTTLLKALAYVDSGGAISAAERSRASSTTADATPITTLHYRLADVDRTSLASLNLEEPPEDFFVSRQADGNGPVFRIMPPPRPSEAPLRQLASDLATAARAPGRIREAPADGENQVDQTDRAVLTGRQALLDAVAQLKLHIEAFCAGAVDVRGSIDPIRKRADELTRAIQRGFVGADRLLELLPRLEEWVEQLDPTQAVETELWNRTPDAVLFNDVDRNLASSYTINDEMLVATPVALKNLARLAGLDLNELVAAVAANDIARRDTLRNRANRRLAEVFPNAWKQSQLTVELNIEGATLRIGLLEDGVFASQFHERSAGLRMFVAITAFLAARDSGRATILLIDEAETHLHIDAQADLVQMFSEQGKADKVIYTTHSPACLPADLGVGIRAVVPVSDETSRVENHYWRLEGAGFTSLMVALGASAAAFTPARCAVVGEGATEMILLPTLMREAIESDSLPYQVTPGLSEIPPEAYPDLDFQAAKVAFLVDGDKGGADLSKRIGRTVPKERIANLQMHGIENTLDSHAYRSAYVAVLADLNPTKEIGEPPDLPNPYEHPWAKAMETWANESGLRVACKRDVANHIIELDKICLSPDGRAALRAAHHALLKALGLSDQARP